MTGIVGTTRDDIRVFVDRIQRLDTKIKEFNGDKSDIYAEAKGKGFDVKALKAVVAYLRKDRTEAEEQAAIFDLYLNAVTGTGNAPARVRAQEPPTKQSPSAVPIPDTTPRDGGAAAPAATGPRSTGIDGPVLSPPSPGTGPTNSDDPYNCIPPQFDRTRELRA